MLMNQIVNDYNIGKQFYKKRKYKRAYEVFFKLAELGDINSQVLVGNMLYNGQGIDLDIDAAYDWFKIAAKSSNAEALYYLAMHYLEDLNEVELGKEFLLKAVNQNYSQAITTMAYYYEFGDHGYKKDEFQAIYLYKKACILENKDACKKLFLLMKRKNILNELQKFIQEQIGYLKYLKILLS